MSNQPLIGIDVELTTIPFASNPDADYLDRYDMMLQMIGGKDHPSETPNGQFHNDCWWVEFAPKPAESPAQLLTNYLRMEEDVIQAMAQCGMGGETLVGFDWLDKPKALDQRRHRYLAYEMIHLGCSPDLVHGMVRQLPQEIKQRSVKEAGCHFHLDIPPEYMKNVQPQFNEYAGVDVLVEVGTTHIKGLVDELRTRLDRIAPPWRHPSAYPWYRVPGSYRIKPYGIEYRSLGASLCNNKSHFVTAAAIVHDFMWELWSVNA